MTELGTSTSTMFEGHNPFDVDPRLDYLLEPNLDAPGWSQTMLFTVWSPAHGVGLFAHAGTHPADPTLWCCRVFAYLPDGKVAVDRSWGRPGSDSGPETGCFGIVCEEPLRRWRVWFDGAGELTTTTAMGQRLIGAGPTVPMRYEVDVRALGPVWDLYAATGIGQRDWGGMHLEQNCLATGSLSVAGRTWEFDDGVSLRDRSAGPRSFDTIGGDRFFGMSSAKTGRSVQGVILWDRSGNLELSTVSVHEDDKLEVVLGGVEMTGIEDTAGAPDELMLTFERGDGKRIEARGERLHTATISVIDPNFQLNGIHHEGDPMVFTESPIRFTWPDGDVLFGHLERGARLSTLNVPGA